MTDDETMDPRMALYFQQIHDAMRRIHHLSAKHGMPHTISITAHFDQYAVTNDVRILDVTEATGADG